LTSTAYQAGAIGPPVAVRQPAERLVNALLYLTILISPAVYIEPAPYEGAFALLALTCIAAKITVDRLFAPLIVLLAAWNVGGLLSLTQASHSQDAITFVAVSIYLSVSAILFACLFSHDVDRRLGILRSAYIAAAVIVASIGIAAYFKLIPGAEIFVMDGARIRGAFKDPNVLGPFLVLPILLLVMDLLQRQFSVWRIAAMATLLFALLMSFSRGAWLNFAISGAVMTGLLFLTAPSPRIRLRLVAMAAIALLLLAGLVAAALSIDAVGNMFTERARVTQDYDVGDGGRFTNQLRAIPLILDHPNGVGPYQLRHYIGIDPHQVYLNAFASYGWLGGISYIALILATLAVGFRYVLVRTSWQPYLVASYAAFLGMAIEGFVIDTDHWRHFYLVLGLVWGLSAATRNALNAHLRATRPG
jgi:O-Antigen ligase